jgi:hypothetical protein
MEPAHIVSEEEEECEEETDGTLITMETTLGLDKSVSSFSILYKCIHDCTIVRVKPFISS